MKQKDRSFSWTRTLYLLVALVMVSLALILLSQGRNLQPVETIANTVLTPIQQAASNVTSTVGDWMAAIGNSKQLEEKNKQLQQAVDALTTENAQLQAKATEADQLKAMLKFQADQPQIQAVLANNIGGDPNALSEILTIDKGTVQGIKVGMAVVSPGGILVGQISAVKPDRSTVLLITDVQSLVPVATQRTQTPGVLEGRWQQGGNMVMSTHPTRCRRAEERYVDHLRSWRHLPKGPNLRPGVRRPAERRSNGKASPGRSLRRFEYPRERTRDYEWNF